MQKSSKSLRTYVAECIRLLYWAYFKPYSFASWLREIHPELKPQDNPFRMRSEFANNPRLARYAWQVWLLTAVLPVPIMLLVYRFARPLELFNICFLLLGWLIGLYFAFQDNQKLLRKLQQVIWILVVIPFGGTPVSLSKLPSWLIQFWFIACGLAVALDVHWGIAQGFSLGASWFLAIFFAARMDLPKTWLLVWLLTLIAGFGVAFSIVFLLIPWLIWVSELLWMVCIYLFSRRGSKVWCLTYLPSRFNERIFLPLPFMAQIIVEAHQENPTAARQTINYLLTYTNQEQVAAHAIAEIATDYLKRCLTLEDIVEVGAKLSWIPLPLPKRLNSALPQLLDVSQDVQAAMKATSPYSKYRLLYEPIADLHQLHKQLDVSKDALLAKTFGSIAQNWLDIIEKAQPTYREASLYSAEIRQVYIPGSALDPATAKERFKGRDYLFRQIEKLADENPPPVLLLYGRRRTGKTSALKYLPNRVAANLVPLLVDVQGAAIATTLSGLAEQIARQIMEATQRLPRRLDFPDPDAIFRVSTDPFVALYNWFGEIEQTFPDKKFLLCLDEFPRLGEFVELTGSKAPLNFLRSMIQHRQQWILLFSSSHLRWELPPYWSDYLINTISLQLDYLQESEARELIIHPVDDFPDNIYESAAVDRIIYYTRCQPYLVQLVCHEIIELLNHYIRKENRLPKTTTATVEDVETIIPKVLERGDQYFRELWINLTPEEQNLLQHIAQSSISDSTKLVRRLIKKGILQQDEQSQEISFQVPLVQKYILHEFELEN
ncbi:MAG: ATP-binding protein [Calothrix sp. C42_A2020_038]|nr:ATP-binding protein [Calothrix sp. C42_A2020_038]